MGRRDSVGDERKSCVRRREGLLEREKRPV